MSRWVTDPWIRFNSINGEMVCIKASVVDCVKKGGNALWVVSGGSQIGVVPDDHHKVLVQLELMHMFEVMPE